jgi:hypothetical protein
MPALMRCQRLLNARALFDGLPFHLDKCPAALCKGRQLDVRFGKMGILFAAIRTAIWLTCSRPWTVR